MSDDHGGWCAPDNAYCFCGQVFDENHDRVLCAELVSILETDLIDISDYILKRGGVE